MHPIIRLAIRQAVKLFTVHVRVLIYRQKDYSVLSGTDEKLQLL